MDIIDRLSPRQKDVSKLLILGYDNYEIADELYISVLTVKCHVQAIREKLGQGSRIKTIIFLICSDAKQNIKDTFEDILI
jgi:DNA-binding NarL/FixJ family response regulator